MWRDERSAPGSPGDTVSEEITSIVAGRPFWDGAAQTAPDNRRRRNEIQGRRRASAKSLLGDLIQHDGIRHGGALVARLQNDLRRRDGA